MKCRIVKGKRICKQSYNPLKILGKGIWIFVTILIIVVIGVIVYFLTQHSENNCFQGDFKCYGNIAKTCSPDGKWIEEICRSPKICGGGGFMGCGISNITINYPEPEQFCGDGICQNDESKNSCPDDCGLPLPVCGNNKCEVFKILGYNIDEFLVCPSDCGIICGDGKCIIDPYDERKNCPVDCKIPISCGNGICQEGENKLSCPYDCKQDINNQELIYKLNQKQRPLVGGLSIIIPQNKGGYIQCSLGAIVNYNGKNYILTAGHCVAEGTTIVPKTSDLGKQVKQGSERIGQVFRVETNGIFDVSLISIGSGINSEYKDFLGNKIEGFGQAVEGMKVYKIGTKTGLTYGTIGKSKNVIFGWGKVTKGYVVDNADFCDNGDSGSAIITVDSPHKIVGILSRGDVKIFPNLFEAHCFSNYPEDIKSKMGL